VHVLCKCVCTCRYGQRSGRRVTVLYADGSVLQRSVLMDIYIYISAQSAVHICIGTERCVVNCRQAWRL